MRRIAREQLPLAKARHGMNDFLDEIYQLGIGRTRDDTEYLWKAFCNHMLGWLLVKDKPVDLYFAKLHPTLYRRGWMEKLHHKIGVQFRRAHRSINSFEFRQSLSMGSLLAVGKNGACHRYIEVELCDSWWREHKRVEKLRLARLNRYLYAEYISDFIREQADVSTCLYAAHLAAAHTPHGIVKSGDLAGTFQIAGRRHPKLRFNDPVPRPRSLEIAKLRATGRRLKDQQKELSPKDA